MLLNCESEEVTIIQPRSIFTQSIIISISDIIVSVEEYEENTAS